MAMTERDHDKALQAFFAEARHASPEPSAELLARVLADAEAEQARQAATGGGRAAKGGAGTAVAGSAWRGLRDILGGWGGIGGLAAAGVAGLWIGFSGVGTLGMATADLWGGGGTIDDAGFATGDLLALTMVLEEEA